MNSSISLVFGIILAALISQSLGHSYLTNPISRSNQKQSNTGCRGPACLGPCDRSLATTTRPPVLIQRGASISVEWPRNNHAGGFIRLAWAPTPNSDSHAAFDAGVQQFSCHEVGGCKPDNVNNPNGGDSAPADGSFQPCKLTINVPLHLTNGAWTLQWAWFGGAFELGDYYSCVDYTITGGPSSAVTPAPVFIGGDFTYPGQQKCKFFNTDRLHKCVNEPCNNPVYPPGERSGMPFMSGTPASPITTGAAAPVTSRAATTRAVTSGAAPLTTGRVLPSSTTGAITSGRVLPAATTGSTPVQPPVGTGNCDGATIMSISTAEVVAIDTWRSNFMVRIRITVGENILNDWRLQIIYPPSSINAQVSNVYNAGKLSCQSSSPVRHAMIKPVASWAKNLNEGSVIEVEVEVNNAGVMTPDYIQQNMQLKLYKL